MTAEPDLLPLPEWTKRDDLGGLVPSEVRAEMHAYARANMEPLLAENERLRAEVRDAYAAADSKAGWEWKKRAEQAEARADRLVEALQVMVEMVEMNGLGRDYAMDVARAALAQEDHND